MRSTVIWSFLSLVTLAAGGLISGCDSDATIAKGGEGESCARTADCNDGLKCRDNVCTKGSGSGGSNNGEGGDGPEPGEGGSGATGPGEPKPVLSSEGESCTKRADCDEGLACFNQRCVMDATGEGGGGNLPSVRLGAPGETCQVTADCDDGLSCLPGGQLNPGVPVGFLGVCGLTPGGFAPSGKDCSAECKEAADCCELPLEVQVALVPVVESCADLDVALTGVNCAAANPSAANQALCFARDTYCNCDDTWECEAGQCVYQLSCADETQGPVLQTEGCPTFSRSGRPLFGCNEDLECAPAPAGNPLCEEDADCDQALMTDLGLTCEDGECTCYQESGCYRRCDRDLDCAPGKVCDTENSVCVPEAQCATNSDCANNPAFGFRFACVEEMCQLTCTNDFECNGGTVAGINTLICAPDHVCRTLGCSSDSQCSSGPNNTGVKMFCTETPAVAGGAAPSSAITGGQAD